MDVLQGLILVHLLDKEIGRSWRSLGDIPVVVVVVGKRLSRRANRRAKRRAKRGFRRRTKRRFRRRLGGRVRRKVSRIGR